MADLLELLGAKKFVSEKELNERRGGREEDTGTIDERPLYEKLAEQRAMKEEEQKNKFKHLPPRNYDDEDLYFLQGVESAKIKEARKKDEEVNEEIASFHLAQQKAVESFHAKSSDVRAEPYEEVLVAVKQNQKKSLTAPAVVIKPKAKRKPGTVNIGVDDSATIVVTKKAKKETPESKPSESAKGKEEGTSALSLLAGYDEEED